MKKINIILIFIATALTVLFSCKKESDSDEDTPEEQHPDADTTAIDFSVQGIDNQVAFEFTQQEKNVADMPDESESKPTYFATQNDSLFFFNLAQEVLQNNSSLSKSAHSKKSFDDQAEESIVNGENINRFSDQYEIEQILWNSGTWGASNWGNFSCYYNTAEYNGLKYLVVVFHKPKGFSRGGSAYLKLGTVNSGKVLVERAFNAGDTTVVLPYVIELDAPGCLNIFPLIKSRNGYRSYLNPIMIKYKPIIAKGWQDFEYNDLYGTIDGVGVYCNGEKNIGSGSRQCVELCKRYLKTMHPELKRSLNSLWGNANQWPDKRANDDIDVDKYIVLENNGENQVREGDIIVFQHSTNGHVAVVIKNAPDYISIAHQNGYIGTYDIPIGTKLAKEGKYVTNYHPTTKKSPIYAGQNRITHFIRFNNTFEHYQEPHDAKPINLEYELSSESVHVDDQLSLIITSDTKCQFSVKAGSWQSGTAYYSTSYNIDLPTSYTGYQKVTIKAVSEEGETEEKSFTYHVEKKGIIDEPKKELVLDYDLSGNQTVAYGEELSLTIYANYNCDIFLNIDGEKSKYTGKTKQNTKLPTSKPGTHTVKFYGVLDDKEGKTYQFTYTVNEPKTPIISASLSATTVEEGGNVRLTVSTDMDCDIKYTVNGSTYTYYSSTYLPTNTAGNYTVKVTATAKDGGKTANDFKYYTVNKKYEPITVNLQLGNPPSVIYKGDNATVSFSTGGVPCKIEYQYGTMQKQTYSNNATEGRVPLFTTYGADDVKLTVYATPLEDSQNTYSKSITYNVKLRFQINFTEPNDNTFEVGELQYFKVHSPYYSVDASFKYYQHSDLNEYEDDFNQYYHTLYTDEPGHYKLTIRVTSRDNSSDYETYTYEYDVEEEDTAPVITFDESSNQYIDVDDYYTLTIYTDKKCKIKVYDDDEDLIKSKSNTDYITITVPTSYKVGRHYIYVTAISDSGLETEKSWRYTLEEVKIPDVRGSKIIDVKYFSNNVELYPNTDAEFSVYYRGDGIFRVSKNTGYFKSSGIFGIVDASTVENGWQISDYAMTDHVNKDGDAYYDLQIPKKNDLEYYIIEIHEVSYGYSGYYIGPFTY